MERLERLFRPRSIAVIGGGAWCANVIRECHKIGFDGEVWPVHPTRAEIGGRATVSDPTKLPAAPDAAFVGVNRESTIAVVATLASMGAGGAVCFASGFREATAELADGATLQDALLQAAGDMPILGPNCYGFLNFLDGVALWPDHHGGIRSDRGVAILTQSSNIALNLTMQKRGLPLAYVVTVGNQAQTGMAEIGNTLLEDPRVTALGLHIEGIGDLRALENLARTAHGLGKGVVALKVGKSEQARAATISHTASLAGSEAGARALLRRLGIGQVTTIPMLLEVLKLLHVTGPLPSARIASASCSGGEASLIADTADGTSVTFPPLSVSQSGSLREVLGPRVALANPLDYHTYIWADQFAMTDCFAALADPALDFACIVMDQPRADRCDAAEWDAVPMAVEEASRRTGVPMGIVASMPENLPEDLARDLIKRGIVPFSGIAEAVTALEVAVQVGRSATSEVPILLADPAHRTHTLSEAEAKRLIAQHGVPVPTGECAVTPDDAAGAAARIGFPVALKGMGIAHKTEAGAVRLGLTDPCETREAARAMNAASFLVERMVEGAVAELLVGVVHDPAHGYVLTIGAGGLLAEVLCDSANLILPASREEVVDTLAQLRVAIVLKGYRGRPAADTGAVADTVMAVQSCVIAAEGRIVELEINPLICTPDGVVAADALMTLGERDD